MQHLGLKPKMSEKFVGKTKIWSIHNLLCRKLQLSVRILPKICCICQKIATSCLTYFFSPMMPLVHTELCTSATTLLVCK